RREKTKEVLKTIFSLLSAISAFSAVNPGTSPRGNHARTTTLSRPDPVAVARRGARGGGRRAVLGRADEEGPRPLQGHARDPPRLSRLDHLYDGLLGAAALRAEKDEHRDDRGARPRQEASQGGLLGEMEGAGLRQQQLHDHPLGR